MLGGNNLIGKSLDINKEEVITSVIEDNKDIKGKELIFIHTNKNKIYEPMYNEIPEFIELVDIVFMNKNCTFTGKDEPYILYDEFDPLTAKKIGSYIIKLHDVTNMTKLNRR